MIIRAATAADLPAIDSIFRQSFCDTFAHLYAPEDLAAFLARFTPDAWAGEFKDPAYAFRIAEVDGQPAGYVKLGPSSLPIETKANAVELRQLYLLKDHHGSGIAVALTDWALEHARSQAFDEMYLTVYIDNHRARRFYDRYGFEPVGSYHFMVGNHADEDIIMRRAL